MPLSSNKKLLLDEYFMLLLTEKRIFLSTRIVSWSRICRKCVCGRGFAPDPTGELKTLPRPPSRLGRGHPFPDPTPFGASTLAPPALGSAFTHNSGYTTGTTWQLWHHLLIPLVLMIHQKDLLTRRYFPFCVMWQSNRQWTLDRLLQALGLIDFLN